MVAMASKRDRQRERQRATFASALAARQMLEEARASVALDLDGGVHTCSTACQKPKCVQRRAAATTPKATPRKRKR